MILYWCVLLMGLCFTTSWGAVICLRKIGGGKVCCRYDSGGWLIGLLSEYNIEGAEAARTGSWGWKQR